MGYLTSKAFWAGALERAVKSAAQAAILAFGAEQLNVLHAAWLSVGGLAGGAAVLSVLTSLITPSMVTKAGTPTPDPAKQADDTHAAS